MNHNYSWTKCKNHTCQTCKHETKFKYNDPCYTCVIRKKYGKQITGNCHWEEQI